LFSGGPELVAGFAATSWFRRVAHNKIALKMVRLTNKSGRPEGEADRNEPGRGEETRPVCVLISRPVPTRFPPIAAFGSRLRYF